MVLGLPALTDKRIKMDMEDRTWRFGVEKQSLEILAPQQFADALKGHKTVYALVVAGTVTADEERKTNAAGTQGVHVGSAEVIPKLPDKLKEYEDVFSSEEASRLPSHEGRDHAIETTAEPPFSPLYNLSNVELAALRTYLDEALAKG